MKAAVRRVYYKPGEVAELLRVSLVTVYRRCEDGSIPSFRLTETSGWRVPIEEFHRKFPAVPRLFGAASSQTSVKSAWPSR